MTLKMAIEQIGKLNSIIKIEIILSFVKSHYESLLPEHDKLIREHISNFMVLDYYCVMTGQKRPNPKGVAKLPKLLQRKKYKKPSNGKVKKVGKYSGIGSEGSLHNTGRRVSSRGLGKLLENGRDYSKPTESSKIADALKNKKKNQQWVQVISVPMGGQNKKH